MASCLGIYFSENFVKYAKLVIDNGNNVRLDHYGTRIAKGGKRDIIDNIIEETSSKNIPVVTNIDSENMIDVSIFDQAQESKYSPDIMKMEFETWCETNQKIPDKYSYVYKLSDYRTSENKHNGVLCIAAKDEIEKSSQLNDIKAVGVYPSKLLYTELPPEEVQSYVIVNLDETLTIETVINRKMFDFKTYDIGMNKILEEFQYKLGTYQKAYTACKQLNVYTEGESNNDKELEQIAEPILQDVLRKIASVVTGNKDTISRVYITGIGTVFNNIDILLTEYLEVKTEILKPKFLQDTTDVRSVSEMLETTSAMVMAYSYIMKKNTFLNYLGNDEKEKKTNSISEFFGKFKNVSFKKTKKEEKTKEDISNDKKDIKKVIPNFEMPMIHSSVVLNTVTVLATFAVLLFVAYAAFSGVYTTTTNKLIADVQTKISNLNTQTAKVNSDITYVNQNTKSYTEINEDVDMLLSQIESGQIGKISTYNVATFLQKIIKVIPKNVTLDTVKSDDNKHVTISMYSSKYADLGYFVAQLKLQGILNSVEVKNVQNSADKITIQIGGELP